MFYFSNCQWIWRFSFLFVLYLGTISIFILLRLRLIVRFSFKTQLRSTEGWLAATHRRQVGDNENCRQELTAITDQFNNFMWQNISSQLWLKNFISIENKSATFANKKNTDNMKTKYSHTFIIDKLWIFPQDGWLTSLFNWRKQTKLCRAIGLLIMKLSNDMNISRDWRVQRYR